MASGKNHFIADVAINIASLPFAFVDPLAYVTGNLLGTILTPDMDLPGTSFPERMTSNFIKYVTGIKSKGVHNVILALSAVYAVLIPHRSWLSHLPIIGTLTRIGFLVGIWWVLMRVVGWPTSIAVNETSILTFLIWDFHTVIHFVMDGGMIQFNGKLRYLLGKPFYKWMKTAMNGDD